MVDGQKVRGFWDGDDAFAVEPIEDIGTMLVGADGDALFSQHAGEAVRITLRIQHTSATHAQLMEKLIEQRTSTKAQLDGFPVSVFDMSSNEGGATGKAFILTAPGTVEGKAAGPREWVLISGAWDYDMPDVNVAA
jgi:hypothetical protein